VQRLGVAAAVVLTPLLLFATSFAALLAGGAFGLVLVLKTIDGGLRYSIYRITNELVYLPVPLRLRERVKPLIDGALGRAAQTLMGATLLALGATTLASPRTMAVLVASLALAWLVAAATLRRPYLRLLRRAISSGALDTDRVDPIDLESAEFLVGHLASQDPLDVLGAMNALSRRGRAGLIPALVLLHPNEAVLTKALEIFAASPRTDWVPLAHGLLEHPAGSLRLVAARAMARKGELDAERLASDAALRVRGYAAVHMALRDGDGDVRGDHRVAALVEPSSDQEPEIGMLAAIADAAPTPRLRSLLGELTRRQSTTAERTELLAAAVAQQRDSSTIPRLLSLLAVRAGREHVRSTLVRLGDPAFDAVSSALRDEHSRPRGLRTHLPKTLARFGTQRAADRLLETIQSESDPLVRYKSLRSLEALVSSRRLRVHRPSVERLCHDDLAAHFSLLAARSALEARAPEPELVAEARSTRPAAERLLLGLLDDKVRQSLERAFRLLKIAHPREDLRHAYLGCASEDAYARATAGEFLDALLHRPEQQELRALLRIVSDDLPDDERARRAAPRLPGVELPTSRDQALTMLLSHDDPTVAALAKLWAGGFDGDRPAATATDGRAPVRPIAPSSVAGTRRRKAGTDA
jgi:hypothetical protein